MTGLHMSVGWSVDFYNVITFLGHTCDPFTNHRWVLACAFDVVVAMSPWDLVLYMRCRAWRAPLFSQTWLIHIAPLHDRGFHFLVHICALIPSPISSHWHRMASWQNGGINSGMRGVILSLPLSGSLSVVLSLCLCSVCNAWPLS